MGTEDYDEQTLFKVHRAIESVIGPGVQALSIITAMQNEGILFRERTQTSQPPTRWRPIDAQGNIGTKPAPENPAEPDPVSGQDDGETGPPEVAQ